LRRAAEDQLLIDKANADQDGSEADNIGYRIVMFDPTDWHTQVEATKQNADSARNALAHGSAISNPITHARGWEKLKASANSERAIVASLDQDVAILKREGILSDMPPSQTFEAVKGDRAEWIVK
jgi:hypothetical protein